MIKAIDLCAGIGGFHLSADMTGKIDVIYAADINKECKVTYDLNFGKGALSLLDLSEPDAKVKIPAHDLLMAGFPCQSFSIAGKQKGFDDERGQVFISLVKIIEHHQPKYLLLENVKNLANHKDGESMNYILDKLESAGYVVYHKILNSVDFGVPQNRERVFFVGIRNDLDESRRKFSFPEYAGKSHEGFRSVLEPKVADGYYYDNTSAIYPKLEESVIREDRIYQYRRYYVRESTASVCPTLTANMGTGGHNVPIVIDNYGIRKLTPRECFRIQGFPDTYLLPNIANSHLYKQAGNSVTVTVIHHLLTALLKHIEPPGGGQRIKLVINKKSTH
jgi:DNA (cytosine-5)-methyltransferase 1